MDPNSTTPAVDLDDEDADLSALDRGDNLTDESDDTDESTDISRDAKGRFAAKDKPAEADISEDKEPEEEAAAADEDADEDGDEDADGKHADVKSLEVARRKALQQRDAERARAQELEARLKALEAQAKPEQAPKVDPTKALNDKLDTLYEQVEEARADADTKKAAQLQREIDSINREIAKLETSRVAERTVTQAQLDARFDAMIDVLEAKYPSLDPESEDYDRETVRELSEAIDAFEKAGRNAPDALRKAVKLVFRDDPFGKQAKAEPKPAEAEKKAPEKKVEPRKTDVKKAVDTAKRQPPDASDRGVNNDSTRIDPKQLAEEDWDALPESKKRELRGDFLGV